MRARTPALSRSRGFTLIELMVVLAIVATLTLMVYPRYTHRIDIAKETALRENLRTLRTVINDFHGDKGRYPMSLEELVEHRYLHAIPIDPMTESVATWQIVQVPADHPPDEGQVYDVRSGASGTSRNGAAYASW